MAENASRASNAEGRSGLIKYWCLVSAALILGVGLLLYSSYHLSQTREVRKTTMEGVLQRIRPGFSEPQLEEIDREFTRYSHDQEETYVDVLIRDIGVALVVAFVLTVMIEFYARRRLQDEISKGVVESTLERFIPSCVFDQVRRNVIGARSIKRNWHVCCVIQPVPDGQPDTFVSKTTIRYDLVNLTPVSVFEQVTAELDADKRILDDLGATLYPRFESAEIDGSLYTGSDLLELLDKSRMKLARTIELKKYPAQQASGAAKISIVLYEIIRAPDTFVWTTTIQTENASITIDWPEACGVDFDVEALHPDYERLKRNPEGRAVTWRLDGGMLAWQGFQVFVSAPAKRPRDKAPQVERPTA